MIKLKIKSIRSEGKGQGGTWGGGIGDEAPSSPEPGSTPRSTVLRNTILAVALGYQLDTLVLASLDLGYRRIIHYGTFGANSKGCRTHGGGTRRLRVLP